jgi:hypothetical protein
LVRAWVEVKPIIKILSALSVGSCRGDVHGWTTVAACMPVSLLRCWEASCSALGY